MEGGRAGGRERWKEGRKGEGISKERKRGRKRGWERKREGERLRGGRKGYMMYVHEEKQTSNKHLIFPIANTAFTLPLQKWTITKTKSGRPGRSRYTATQIPQVSSRGECCSSNLTFKRVRYTRRHTRKGGTSFCSEEG